MLVEWPDGMLQPVTSSKKERCGRLGPAASLKPVLDIRRICSICSGSNGTAAPGGGGCCTRRPAISWHRASIPVECRRANFQTWRPRPASRPATRKRVPRVPRLSLAGQVALVVYPQGRGVGFDQGLIRLGPRQRAVEDQNDQIGREDLLPGQIDARLARFSRRSPAGRPCRRFPRANRPWRSARLRCPGWCPACCGRLPAGNRQSR